MTHSLLLLLKGPMQSWGDSSRYKSRETAAVPTKSGILGLIAAAQGRRRSDPLEDLAQLRLAVRVDQPGTLLRDYQTAQHWQVKEGPAELVTRYYLADAAFVAAVESDDRTLLESMEEALRHPRFPLFLGRRSCPAPARLVLGIRDTDAVQALIDEPWHASQHHRKARSLRVSLPIHRDALPEETNGIAARDVPISFSQEHRQYGWRRVVIDKRTADFDNDAAQESDRFFETVIEA
ncbi:CRISPR-associated protein cas5/casd, subtype I-e [Corynebacterium pyruviciproducens ATCC BAA-1742]|uniref:CRISPR-associated protein cas5/casd, subtype I-e n=1 Tax=Corynebacterium pyruviciproducens ATCC BAA-1742 TaxID=1125779 RepID=S2YVE5_9CORY|nr:type I-E CRISPR-associated protein Cas5/CasD [Corynebacterium pyruviciproducens]EPD68328.1 CRISPR-associated protein cas5/casd, subtype I-e [Corynebacterium pyruviciproducens ATCC BAA-1742]